MAQRKAKKNQLLRMDSRASNPRRIKRLIVFALFGYAILVGPLGLFLPNQATLLDTLIGIPFMMLVVGWCSFDARQRNHHIGRIMRLFLIFVFVIGFPVYLFQTRGIRALNTIGLSLVVVAGMVACMMASIATTLFVCDFLFPGWLE